MSLKKYTFFLLIILAIKLHSEMEIFDYECSLLNGESYLRLIFSRDSNFDSETNLKFIDKFAILWKDIDGFSPIKGTLEGAAIIKVPKFKGCYQLKFESTEFRVILNENPKNGLANGFFEENGEGTLLRCKILKI